MFFLAWINGHADFESTLLCPYSHCTWISWWLVHGTERLYLNFWWVKLELQFLFWSVVSVWNGVCRNGNCSVSESQSCPSTQVTKPLFPPCKAADRRTVGFTSASRCISTSLTSCEGKVCSGLVSGQRSCFWWYWTRQLWGHFCPKIFPFLQSGPISICCLQPDSGCRSSSWNILTCSEGFWPEISGRKTKGILPISQLHLFYVLEHGVQTLCLSIWPCLSNIQLSLTSVKFKPRCQKTELVSAHAQWLFWCSLVCNICSYKTVPLHIGFSEAFYPLELWMTGEYIHLLSSGDPEGVVNFLPFTKIINNSWNLIQENMFCVCMQWEEKEGHPFRFLLKIWKS